MYARFSDGTLVFPLPGPANICNGISGSCSTAINQSKRPAHTSDLKTLTFPLSWIQSSYQGYLIDIWMRHVSRFGIISVHMRVSRWVRPIGLILTRTRQCLSIKCDAFWRVAFVTVTNIDINSCILESYNQRPSLSRRLSPSAKDDSISLRLLKPFARTARMGSNLAV